MNKINITNASLIDISQNSTFIKYLAVFGCKLITHDGVLQVVSKCSKLEHLDIRECSISPQKLHGISRYCTKLNLLIY